MWSISPHLHAQLIDECIKGFPLEACGLFLGPIDEHFVPTGEITQLWPARNIEESARIYTVHPEDMLAASRYSADNGIEIVGVYHSHTHTHAQPSPTDIDQAVDPAWCYAICSLAEKEPVVHYFEIREGNVYNVM